MLKSNMLEVLKESVLFSSELARKEIEADLSDGIVSFDILIRIYLKLFQGFIKMKLKEKFYRLFKEFFIEKNII